MGTPTQIKTDKGPAYCSQKVRKLLQTWGVCHLTGIPHSPTGQGQAIIERAHQTLKKYLNKFQDVKDVQEWLAKVFFY